MQPTIRFIHAADLHLAAGFSGISREAPSSLANRLQQSTFDALARLVDLCEQEQPDFLLLAGDIYNVEEQGVRAQLALHDACIRLDRLGIPVFIVHGNHDPLSSRVNSLRWPGCVTVFDDQVTAVPVYGTGEDPLAVVHGVSYTSAAEVRNLAALFHRGPEHCAHIGLLHAMPGNANESDRYAPFTQEDLAASGMDYWALGHIHARCKVCSSPLAMYPGCIQGLHINESGEKGCLLVEMVRAESGYAAEATFYPLAPVQWSTLEIAIDEQDPEGTSVIRSLDGLEEHLQNMLDTAVDQLRPGCETLIVRLRLTGRTALNGELRREAVAADLLEHLRSVRQAGRVWIKDIEVLTRFPMDRSEIMARGDLLGEIFRLGDAARVTPEQLETLKDTALAPLFAHSKFRNIIKQPEQAELLRLLDDAEAICMDLLEND